MARARSYRNFRADRELVSALWAIDARRADYALAEGANPNGRENDIKYGQPSPLWSIFLRRAGEPSAQIAVLQVMLRHGLTLHGGGAVPKTRQTMLMRLQDLDPSVADALVDHVGARRMATRLKNQASTEILDPDFWDQRLERRRTLDAQEKLEQKTAPAPATRRGPRL